MYNILAKLILLGAPLNCADANELLSLVRPFDPERLEMTRVIIAHTDPVCFETQKPTEGTDLKSPITLGETKWQRLLTEEFSTILKLVKRKLSSLRNNLFTEALLYKELSKMIVVSEILLASVVFLTIIYAEAQLLYNYK